MGNIFADWGTNSSKCGGTNSSKFIMASNKILHHLLTPLLEYSFMHNFPSRVNKVDYLQHKNLSFHLVRISFRRDYWAFRHLMEVELVHYIPFLFSFFLVHCFAQSGSVIIVTFQSYTIISTICSKFQVEHDRLIQTCQLSKDSQFFKDIFIMQKD